MATAVRTIDHDEIRDWVESKDGRPAIVQGTSGVLRIDFGEPDETLQPVDWDTFFRIFDESNVDFLYDPKGHMVKFVPHGTDEGAEAEEDQHMPRRAARRTTRTSSNGRKKSAGRKKSTSARKTSTRKTSSRKKSTDGRKKSTAGRKKSAGTRKKTTGGRKKTTGARKKTTGTRKKSTSSRKKSTSSRKKSTNGRKKSTNGRKKSTSSRKKSTNGRKKSTNGRKKSSSGRKYGKKASRKVGRVMHEYKHGSLKSGKSGRKVKSRKQAIAIGISEARREGDKVPARRKSSGRKKRS